MSCGYGVEEIDRTDATRRGADSDTEFVMWLSNARNNQDITLKKSTSLYNDDSITFKLLFKETVKFNSNGGSSVVDQMVVMGETATEPTTPTRSNYTFKGWFSDESLTTAYDFSTAVNDNITLYAKWEKKPYSSSSSSSSSPSSSNKTGNNNTGATAETGTTNTGANTPTVDPQAVAANGYTNEMNEAYEFAFKNGITTMKTIEQADMNGSLNRIAMAKMLSQYAINILKKIPDTSKKCNFGDVSSDLDKQYNDGVTLACQLGIMGVNITNFRPNEEVTKAEFGTALSRMLFGLADGTDNYYSTHLAKLKKEKIIINDDPTLKELRGYVMLMLMRSAK